MLPVKTSETVTKDSDRQVADPEFTKALRRRVDLHKLERHYG